MTAGRQRGTPPWRPLRRGRLKVSPALAARAAADPQVAAAVAEPDDVWLNDQYVVLVFRRDDGSVKCLSIRRQDRRAPHDWRHFQRIKNQLAGEDCEAVELYPAEDRLVDSANQYFLWVYRPGERVTRPGEQQPLGFTERLVTGDGDMPGARQRPLSQEAL